MKAIKVTTKNKTDNPDFFNGNTVGNIYQKQLPTKYNGVIISNGGNYRSRTDLHLQDGFFDLVQPSFDSLTHKRGNEIIPHEDENKYTYNVIALTTQEIATNEQNALDADEHAQKVSERKQKGIEDFDRLMAIIERKWKNNEFSANNTTNNNLAKGAREYFFNSLLPITYGLWDIAQGNLNTVPNTGNQVLLAIYNNVKSEVDTYVSGTFQKKAK